MNKGKKKKNISSPSSLMMRLFSSILAKRSLSYSVSSSSYSNGTAGAATATAVAAAALAEARREEGRLVIEIEGGNGGVFLLSESFVALSTRLFLERARLLWGAKGVKLSA